MIPDYNRAARLAYKTILSLHIESFPIDPMMIFSFCKNTVIRTYEEAAPYFGLSDADHFKWYVADNKDALTVRREYDDGTIRYEMIYEAPSGTMVGRKGSRLLRRPTVSPAPGF